MEFKNMLLYGNYFNINVRWSADDKIWILLIESDSIVNNIVCRNFVENFNIKYYVRLRLKPDGTIFYIWSDKSIDQKIYSCYKCHSSSKKYDSPEKLNRYHKCK